MRKLLSIIIPTYNAEKFLDKGLPSLILEKAELREKMEVLIVNDGAKDRSVEVAQIYVDQYPDLFQIINKENGGHGSAINVGVEHATAKYFKVMDADDWFTTSALEHLLEVLQEIEDGNAEIQAMLISYRTYNLILEEAGLDPYESKPVVIDNIAKETQEFTKGSYHLPIVTLRQIMNHWDDMYWGLTFHGILYKTDFYKGLNHKLIEGYFYEDQEFAIIPLAHAEKIALFPEELYEYRIGDVNQSIGIKSSLSRLDHYEAVIMRLLDGEKESKSFPAGGKDYWATKTSKFIDDYYQLCLVKNPDKKMLRKRMADFARQIEKKSPKMYQMVKKNIFAFNVLNRAHMSEETFQEKFIPLLHKLRGTNIK